MTNQKTLRGMVGRTLTAIVVAMAVSAVSVCAAPQSTAKPTELDVILKALATWDGGLESAAVWKLRDYVGAHRADAAGRVECETKLLQFMKSAATQPAKTEVSRQLRGIAGDSAVAALQAMLADERISDLALYVLRQIPGPAAGKALVQAVGTAAGATKSAVIAAVGERREPSGVGALTPLLQQPAFASAAAVALGRIGGDAAAAALTTAAAGAPAPLKSTLASALLQCAEAQVAAKNLPAALAIYAPLAADSTLPDPIRRAAAMGRIAASGAAAPALLVSMLTGSDAVQQAAAVARLRTVFTAETIAPVCDAWPKLAVPVQIQVLAAITGFGSPRVRQTALDALRSDTLAVRLAALGALESVGGAADVQVLADRAANTTGPEQAAVRATLAGLKGRAVDEALLAALSGSMSGVSQGELLIAAGERRLFPARSAMVKALGSSDSTLRVQALRSLRGVGTPSDSAAVLDVLIASTDDRETTEAEKTLVALATKQASPDGRSRFVRDRLAREKKPDARVRLIAVLPQVGDTAALPVLRSGLGDPDPSVYDAVVRAFAAWPTAAAREDVLRLARDSRNETHRLLAITGLIRLVGLDTTRDPVAAVADLRAAASFAWRPEEQRLVLGALQKFPCREALDLASEFLREPSVAAEAKAAVEKIKPRLVKEIEQR